MKVEATLAIDAAVEGVLLRIMVELQPHDLTDKWLSLLSLMVGQLTRAVGYERAAELLVEVVALQHAMLPGASVEVTP